MKFQILACTVHKIMHVSKSVKDGHTVYRRINPKALCLFKVGGIIIKAI